MHKSIKGEISKKVLKRELSFSYMTHLHALFYITVKYHQNIPNGIQVMERTRKCLRPAGRTPDSSLYPRTFRSGDKKGSLPELIVYQQNLFKLAGRPAVTRSGEQENGLPNGLSR